MKTGITATKQTQNILLPIKLEFKFIDIFKVIYSCFLAFNRTFIVKPGLYFIGDEYDMNAPLLVTCNYHMTVYLLWKKLRKRKLSVLVIDTKGINVWCSSGKGQFSSENILNLLTRYQSSFSFARKLELVLPKLSLSGVCLKKLKDNGIDPKIGPVYLNDLPDYLDDLPLKNRNKDKYKFSLKDRLFSLVPTLVQQIKLSIVPIFVLSIIDYYLSTSVSWQLLFFIVLINILYVVVFPVLPSKSFVFKSLPLIAVLLIYIYIDYSTFQLFAKDLYLLVIYSLFSLAYSVYFALAFTGSSGVSNYTLVKKEIIRYLPVPVITGLFAIIVLVIKVIRC